MEMNMSNLLWFFAIILLAGGNSFGGLFGGRPMGPPPATQEDLAAAINNQTLQNQLSSLAVETANNNYETAQLLNQQSNLMQQQNNTNLINVIQGFNAVTQQIQGQTNQLAQAISQLGFQLDNCCCSIKTQMLQDRLTDKTAEAVALQNKLDNRDQTQTILGSLGRFVAWAGSGSQAATVGS
jgi:hypothetical protein